MIQEKVIRMMSVPSRVCSCPYCERYNHTHTHCKQCRWPHAWGDHPVCPCHFRAPKCVSQVAVNNVSSLPRLFMCSTKTSSKTISSVRVLQWDIIGYIVHWTALVSQAECTRAQLHDSSVPHKTLGKELCDSGAPCLVDCAGLSSVVQLRPERATYMYSKQYWTMHSSGWCVPYTC